MAGRLEARRLAIAAALRRIAAEPPPAPAPDPAPAAAAADVLALTHQIEAVGRSVESLRRRLDAVETTQLEAAWHHPPAEPRRADRADEVDPPGGPDEASAETPTVPKLDLAGVRMSATAADALFGG